MLGKNMRAFEVSDALLDRASKAATGKPYNGRTIKGAGEGQVIGYIGEAITWRLLRERFSSADIDYVAAQKFDRDFDVFGVSIDTKFCRRTVPPLPEYSGYVEALSFRQHHPQVYLLGSYDERAQIAHVIGWLRRKEYEERSRFVAQGEWDDGKLTPADCYKVTYSTAHPAETLLDRLEVYAYQLAFHRKGAR